MSTRTSPFHTMLFLLFTLWPALVFATSALPITSIAGGNQGQSQTVTLEFECLLTVQIFNGSQPASGATVVFASPSSGASALMTDASSSGSQLEVTTDSDGIASVIATADVVPGTYNVTATVTSLGSSLLTTPISVATYPMTNLSIGEPIFSDGLENESALCGSFVN